MVQNRDVFDHRAEVVQCKQDAQHNQDRFDERVTKDFHSVDRADWRGAIGLRRHSVFFVTRFQAAPGILAPALAAVCRVQLP